MSEGFSNQIIGGLSKLIRNAIMSPDYVPGVSGWSINKDGTAEFNDAVFRGTVVIDSIGEALLVYDGVPAAGNLILAIASVSGTDTFGNAFFAGLTQITTATNPSALHVFTNPAGDLGLIYMVDQDLNIAHTPLTAGALNIFFSGLSNGLKVGSGPVGQYYAEEVRLNSTVMANNTVTTLTLFTNIQFTSDYGSAFNLVNGVWFCPVDGWYDFTFSIGFTTWTAGLPGSRWFMEMTRGAARFAAMESTSTDGKCMTLTATKFLSKGETVSFVALQATGAARTIDISTEASYITVRRSL